MASAEHRLYSQKGQSAQVLFGTASTEKKKQRRRANAALTKHSFKRQSAPPVSVGLFAIASLVTQSPFYQLIFTHACARNMWE